MTVLSFTNPADGETADAADVNTPFNAIKTVINGNIDSTNITDGGITPNELTSGTGTSWAWQSWTPTLTNMTLGNGTVTAKSVQIGKTVNFRFVFTLGSTSAVATGPTFSLPVTATSYNTASSGKPLIGLSRYEDNGVAATAGWVELTSTTTATLLVGGSAGSYVNISGLTATIPFTFATGDEIIATGTYEAA